MKPAINKSPEVVTAIELAAIKRDREKLAALRAEADVLANALREREDAVIARIEAGVRVDGKATVITRRRQNISWLTVVQRMLGKEAIIETKNQWPVSFHKELRIA